MKSLIGNDPRVKAAARRLNITVVLRAWEQGGKIYVQTPWQTHEVDPDLVPDPAGHGQESVTTEDFTVIPGVGPATARKLRAAGIRTWDDLRTADLETIVPRQADAIAAYLKDNNVPPM